MKRAWPTLPSPRKIWGRSSGLARLTMYLAGVEIFLYLLQKIFRAFRLEHAADTLSGWISSIGVAFILLGSILLLRWVRRKLMWSLRNRLIITYVFIGVIPVILLVSMAVVAGFLFTGQFATFLATSDIQNTIDNLNTANAALAHAVAGRLRQPGNNLSIPASRRFPGRYVTVWYQGKADVLTPAGVPRESFAPVPAPPEGHAEIRSLVKDGGRFYLRALATVPAATGPATVISSVPLDRPMLESMTGDLGEVTVTEGVEIELTRDNGAPKTAANASQAQNESGAQGKTTASLTVRGGSVPPPSGTFDQTVDFLAPVKLLDWNTGKMQDAGVVVSTRKSLLFNRLFANLGSYANAILIVLAAIALALGVLELLALVIGVRLTRTMTGSVYQLYTATQHINRGDLGYRIQVKSNDQLAELETSFNSMSQSLERLIAEQKEKQRIESELAIAQEVQAQLFPREISELATLDVQGVCRPARTVSGDYYDFLPLGEEKLGIAVGDISGKGISAALLMATIHSAVRVYEMGRVPAREQLVAAGGGALWPPATSSSLMPTDILQSPGSVLSLLNRHLYHSTPAEKYATMFFGVWDGRTRRLTYSNGGHLPPVIVRQNGSVEKLEVCGTVVGLFDEVAYEEKSVQLYPGDLFVAYSDGLTEPENEFGEFGEERLIDLVRAARSMPLARVSEVVSTSVLDWIGAAEQPDDVTLVLARAK